MGGSLGPHGNCSSRRKGIAVIKKNLFIIIMASFMAYSADYLPLAVGNQWKYQINTDAFNAADSNIQMTVTITEDTVIAADSIYRAVYIYSAVPEMVDSAACYFLSRGNDVFAFDSLSAITTENEIFEHKPVSGNTWNNGDGNPMNISFIGDVTGPAGKFSSCFMLSSSSDTLLYAPDVGQIKMVVENEVTTLLSCKVVNKTPVIASRPSGVPSIADKKGAVSRFEYALFDLRGRCIRQGAMNTGEGIGAQREMLASGAYFMAPRQGHGRKAEMLVRAKQ
jgi:hypothetical protein